MAECSALQLTSFASQDAILTFQQFTPCKIKNSFMLPNLFGLGKQANPTE